jgi:putative transposase
MEKIDARSLCASAKEHIRQLVVKAVLNGEKQKEVATLLGVTPQVKDFSTVEELRQALIDFKRIYNANWILQRHGYKTPAQVRQEQLEALRLAA